MEAMKLLMLTAFIMAGLVVTSGCASHPMRERLERNLVYQCSLELLDKNVTPADAEKICSSAHQAEMTEKSLAAQVRAGRVPQPQVNRAPASAPTQGGAPLQVEQAQSNE